LNVFGSFKQIKNDENDDDDDDDGDLSVSRNLISSAGGRMLTLSFGYNCTGFITVSAQNTSAPTKTSECRAVIEYLLFRLGKLHNKTLNDPFAAFTAAVRGSQCFSIGRICPFSWRNLDRI